MNLKNLAIWTLILLEWIVIIYSSFEFLSYSIWSNQTEVLPSMNNTNCHRVKRLYNRYSKKQWKRKVNQKYASYMHRVHARVYGEASVGHQEQEESSSEDIADQSQPIHEEMQDGAFRENMDCFSENKRQDEELPIPNPSQNSMDLIMVESEEDVWLEDNSCDVYNDFDSEYRYSDDDEDEFEMEDSNGYNCQIQAILDAKEDGSIIESDEEDEDETSSKLIPASRVTRSLKKILVPWAIEYNIPQNAMSKLLHGVRSELPETSLPFDPRTLLGTKSNISVEELGGGYYCHFGLAQCIQKIIRERKARGIKNKKADVLINIDGAPLGASSEKNLWPILCSDRLIEDVYIIGVYAGVSKPTDSNEFLKKFVDEAIELINNGFSVDEDDYEVVVYALVCDTPAKAYILKIKYHMGYFSCTKCEIEGEHIDSVCFPGPAGIPRTDEKFRENSYKDDYQQGETELNRIPKLGLVSGVVLDPMHLVFIGVMKKILLILMFVTSIYRLPARVITAISERLKKIKDYIPCEFARKVRELKFIKFYKATELRQFLLYSGIVALKGLVHRDVYLNFLTLHVAISILSHPLLCKDGTYLDYAEKLLQKFVSHFQNLYGAKFVSFNVHGLLHLVNDVRKYGHLENFSAFRFENFIGKLKKLIRKGNQPLQQIIRRSAEIESLQKSTSSRSSDERAKLSHEHRGGPSARDFPGATQYKRAQLRTFSINCDSNRENCLLIDGESVVEALNIIQTPENEIYIVGREMKITGDFYDCPCSSSILNIHLVNGYKENIGQWSIERVTAKMCRLPYENQFVVIPMLHTYEKTE